MGALIEQAYDGKELEIHTFDDKENAFHYVRVSHKYTFDRHEPWAFTEGVYFYIDPKDNKNRASLRMKNKKWQVCFYTA